MDKASNTSYLASQDSVMALHDAAVAAAISVALERKGDRHGPTRAALRAEVERLAAQAAPMLTDAARDVLAERQRQISAEGWTPEHDDEHDAWSMAVAAACYSLWDRPATQATTGRLSNLWQWTGWDQSWFKPKDPRRNLVRAAALLLAEIERLDRAGRTIPPSGVIGGAA